MEKIKLIKIIALMTDLNSGRGYQPDLEFYVVPEAIACIKKYNGRDYAVTLRQDYLTSMSIGAQTYLTSVEQFQI